MSFSALSSQYPALSQYLELRKDVRVHERIEGWEGWRKKRGKERRKTHLKGKKEG
jgi:hypothetical protein